MKIFVYSMREFDELKYFKAYAKERGIELDYTVDIPTLQNVHLAKGASAVSIITNPTDRTMLKAWKSYGIGTVSTRTVGYDHIDLCAAKDLGISVCNATYSPECVAEYTVMLMLNCLRKTKLAFKKNAVNDFGLYGMTGGVLEGKTVGIIGMGKIGKRVAELLSVFHPSEILCYDSVIMETNFEKYVAIDTLLSQSDIVTFHLPSIGKPLMSTREFSVVKRGAILINTARGDLIDTPAMLKALDDGTLSAAGLDVIEEEKQICYFDQSDNENFSHPYLAELKKRDNVIYTSHYAFYTDQSVKEMTEHSLESCMLEQDGKPNPWKIV